MEEKQVRILLVSCMTRCCQATAAWHGSANRYCPAHNWISLEYLSGWVRVMTQPPSTVIQSSGAAKPSFDNGWGKCTGCKKWINVKIPNNPVLEFNARGVRFHRKEFCDWGPRSSRRIRLKAKGRSGNDERREARITRY